MLAPVGYINVIPYPYFTKHLSVDEASSQADNPESGADAVDNSDRVELDKEESQQCFMEVEEAPDETKQALPDKEPEVEPEPESDAYDQVVSEDQPATMPEAEEALPEEERDSPEPAIPDIDDDEFEPALPDIDDNEFGIIDDEELESVSPDPDMNKLIGQVLFDEFLLTDLVGSSAAIITYRARQQTGERFVALKTTRQMSPAITSAFVEAATNHLSLDHKNIVASLGLFQTETGCPFYAAEWLDGISLMEISREAGALTDEEELSQIIFEICDALEYAHAKGVTHGELVSGNLIMCLIDDDLHARLTDFGFCRVQEKLEGLHDPSTVDREGADSPLWLADQKKNDILMLGNLIVGLVTGTEVPARSTEPRAPLTSTCPGLMASAVLDAVLEEALEPDPDWRFNSIGEFREAFTNWLVKAREERQAADRRQPERSLPEEQESTGAADSPQAPAPSGLSPLDQLASARGADEPEPVDFVSPAGLAGSVLSGALPAQFEGGASPPRRRTREVRKTLVKMTALKERQVEEDDRFSTQILNVISKEQARVSPARAITILSAKIIAFVSIVTLGFTYVVLNWDQINESWRSTSMQLSEAMRNKDPDEVQPAAIDEEVTDQSAETETAAEPGKDAKGAAGSSTAGGASAPPVRRARPKFSYKESPAYRHWVLHEVGPKRRIEPDK